MLIGNLKTLGGQVAIKFVPGELKALAPGEIDAYVVSTETGFSPLGSNSRFISAELGIPVSEIATLADWNRFENPGVTLVALSSRRPGSDLRGVILAPAETSECYKKFATPRFGFPFRDFYYNVAFEAISHAAKSWGAKRMAFSHLSGCGSFHENIATCVAEALAHFCEDSGEHMESMTFLGDGEVSTDHLAGIRRLNLEGDSSKHRAIGLEVERRDGATLVHLDWSRNA